jgi:hypothetical protein
MNGTGNTIMRMMITIQFDPQHFEAMSALIPKEWEYQEWP